MNPPAGDRPERLLNRRYLAAFALVVLLLLLDQVLVQPPLLRLAVDAPTINVAGRQRMLSQRLAKAALALDRQSSPAGRGRYLTELKQVRAAWTEAHVRLREGHGAGEDASGSAAIRAGFRDLEPSFRRLGEAADRLIEASSRPEPDAQATREALATILETEGTYLERMERIVGLYEGEARARVNRLLWTGRVVTGLVLLALAGVGFLVLRPASRLIQRQVAELRRARDELEARVRDRTRALERANQQVEHEAAQRSRAEARHRAVLEMVSHASRTDTLGEMASGLAHELNQPLGAIANYAEGCLVELEGDRPDLDQVGDALHKIRAAALRAGEVIKRIRRFVTRRSPEREPFEPNQAVAEVADLLRDEARRRQVDLQIELAPDLPCLLGDPIQIQQVLINLVRNAFEALAASESGHRSVVMRTRKFGPEAIELSVTDNGEGIPSDRLAHVFDPYFSTRAEGMGMGLAISRTIVESHQGTLTVESEPGIETTFRFILPFVGAGDDAGTDSLCR